MTAVVVMGVSGSGKSTIGRSLAEALGVAFVEGDDFHSHAELESMGSGHPLTEDERRPWLDALHGELAEHEGDGVVLACSALTERARARLAAGLRDVRFVWLSGDAGLIAERLSHRPDHPVGVSLLPSQLATLEAPTDALRLDVSEPPDVLVARVVEWLDEG